MGLETSVAGGRTTQPGDPRGRQPVGRSAPVAGRRLWRVGRGVLLTALLGAGLAPGAAARAAAANGGHGELQWEAGQLIVGQTSTSAGGDSPYVAPMPKYSGVSALLINYQNGSGICSGTLLPDRRSILTAAHCFRTTTATGNLLGTAAWFYGGANPDTVVVNNPLATAVAVSNVFIHPDYTGDVIDKNDIAVLRLNAAAPSFATSYGLSSLTDLTGVNFNVAGYGRRSSTGGAEGVTSGLTTGVLRQGDNRFEFRLGDPAFNGGWSTILGEPQSQIDQVYLSDFDNGTAARDSGCLVAVTFTLSGPNYCNTGRGATEVSIASGDSGGPQFDASMNIAAITSFGLTFGSNFGDVNNTLNFSWGEFGGYVPVAYHSAFIRSNLLVPTPLPLLGAAVALRISRRLRRRIRSRESGSGTPGARVSPPG